MFDSQDEGTRIGVWVALGVVFAIVFGILLGVSIQQTNKAKARAYGPEAMLDGPLAGELLGKIHFDSGVATLPPDAVLHIAVATKALAAAPQARLVIAAFHDAVGDAARHRALARLRALAARDALRSAGVDPARLLLRRPEATSGDGSLQEVRRVELRLVD